MGMLGILERNAAIALVVINSSSTPDESCFVYSFECCTSYSRHVHSAILPAAGHRKDAGSSEKGFDFLMSFLMVEIMLRWYMVELMVV
jgi:hypothetical protein